MRRGAGSSRSLRLLNPLEVCRDKSDVFRRRSGLGCWYFAEKLKTTKIPVLTQNMGNFGAMVRTALATGVDAIVVHTQESLPITEDAMKASVGALLHMPICRTRNLLATLTLLQHSGLQLVACTEKGDHTLYDIDLTSPTVLLFGGEGKGIAAQHSAQCNVHVRIPMQATTNSLNLSVAVAVALYERVRQLL